MYRKAFFGTAANEFKSAAEHSLKKRFFHSATVAEKATKHYVRNSLLASGAALAGWFTYQTLNQDTQHQQLQETDVANKIIPKIKEKDCEALLDILMKDLSITSISEKNRFSDKYQDGSAFVITDIGSGEGQMLLTLLRQLFERLPHFTELEIHIHACEPKDVLRQKLIENFNQAKDQHEYMANVELITVDSSPMQTFNPPASDLILSSHSLYYSREYWDTTTYPCSDNILSNWFSSLKPLGHVAVILQSGESSDITGLNGKSLANHQDFEDVMYPLLYLYEKSDLTCRLRSIYARMTNQPTTYIPDTNKDRRTYTNAEIFEECVSHLKVDDLEIQLDSKRSMIQIKFDKINFQQNRDGKFPQTAEVLQLLHFYTRGKFEKFPVSSQQAVLGFFKESARDKEGEAVMTHVNRAFKMSLNHKQ